jgi:hypothetical protein
MSELMLKDLITLYGVGENHFETTACAPRRNLASDMCCLVLYFFLVLPVRVRQIFSVYLFSFATPWIFYTVLHLFNTVGICLVPLSGPDARCTIRLFGKMSFFVHFVPSNILQISQQGLKILGVTKGRGASGERFECI